MSEQELQNIIDDANKEIPEGYRIVADTLPERIKYMVAGLHAYSVERQELMQRIRELENTLSLF